MSESIFGKVAPTSPTTGQNDLNTQLYIIFNVSEATTLGGISFYSNPAATLLPTATGIFAVGNTTPITTNLAPAWDGVAGSGWITTTNETAISLAASTDYMICIVGPDSSGGDSWLCYFAPDVFPITNGAVTAPASSGAFTNCPYIDGGANASPIYPTLSTDIQWFIDAQLNAAGDAGTGAVTAKKASLAGSGSPIATGTGAVSAKKASVSGAGTVSSSRSLFGQGAVSGSISSFTDQQNNGLKFSVDIAGTLTAIWFYSISGAGALPVEVGLFNADTEALIFSDASPSWSGVVGSGWVKYTTSHLLASGTNYMAAVMGDGVNEWYTLNSGYWSSNPSGITSGSLSCPTDADYWVDNSGFAFPNQNFGDFNAWLDVEVDFAEIGIGAVSAKKASLAGSGSTTVTGTGAVSAKKAAASGSGVVTNTATGAVTAGKASVRGSDAPYISVSDDFARADSANLGPNWTPFSWSGSDAIPIVSGLASGVSSTTVGEFWSAGSFDDDQSSKVTVATAPTTGSSYVGVTVRQSGDGGNGYLFLYFANSSSPEFMLFAEDGTADPPLLTSGAGTMSDGDTLKIVVIGTTITCYHNGTQVLTATDSTYTSGAPGLAFFDGQGRVSAWIGASERAGAVSAKKATVSAVGSAPLIGTGAVAAGKASVAGSSTLAGTGAITAKKATVSAIGNAPLKGTGAVASKKASLVGAGSTLVAGTGAVSAKKATLSGTANSPLVGSGAVAGKKASVSASNIVFLAVFDSTDGNGVDTYNVTASTNGGAGASHPLRVLEPVSPSSSYPHAFLFMLPVEADQNSVFGDPISVAQSSLTANDSYNVTIVQPGFSIDPWYADNADDSTIQQESFMLAVVQWVKDNFATTGTEPVYILGFSKSGTGGQQLILRNPTVFDACATWDFPADMDTYDRFVGESDVVFGDQTNFANNYELSSGNLDGWKTPFLSSNRIWLGGFSLYGTEVDNYDARLTTAGIEHTYTYQTDESHAWDSDWMSDALSTIIAQNQPTGTGTVSAKKATIAATGHETDTGTGTVSAKKASVSATGHTPLVGTGAVKAKKAAVSVSVQLTIPGTGNVNTHKATISGTAHAPLKGTGAVAGKKSKLSGSGVVLEPGTVAGSGAVRAHKASIAGTGNAPLLGTGAVTTKKALVAGVATAPNIGQGAISAHKARISGSSTRSKVGKSAISSGTTTSTSISGRNTATVTTSGGI